VKRNANPNASAFCVSREKKPLTCGPVSHLCCTQRMTSSPGSVTPSPKNNCVLYSQIREDFLPLADMCYSLFSVFKAGRELPPGPPAAKSLCFSCKQNIMTSCTRPRTHAAVFCVSGRRRRSFPEAGRGALSSPLLCFLESEGRTMLAAQSHN
jgi:hypothetical protein